MATDHLFEDGLYIDNPNYLDKYNSFIYNKKLEELDDFSVRLHNILKSNNIIFVRDLLRYRAEDFLKFQNSGRKTQREILDFMKLNNLEFGEYKDIINYDINEKKYLKLDEEKELFLISDPFKCKNFTVRTLNFLRNKKIIYNKDLLLLNREVIFANKNAGKKTFEQIEEYLRVNDFQFGDIVYGFSEENLQKLKNKLFTKKNLDISQQDPLDFILKKINILNEKEKKIILERYGFFSHSKTLEEIANSFTPKVTRERIRQIESKSLRKLKIDKEIKILLDNNFNSIFYKLTKNKNFLFSENIRYTNLQPWELLAIDISFRSYNDFFDYYFKSFSLGWHTSELSLDIIENSLNNIKKIFQNLKTPIDFESTYINYNLSKEILLFTLDNRIFTKSIYCDYIIERKNSIKEKRKVNLHLLANKFYQNKIINFKELYNYYLNIFLDDDCSDRDLIIAMKEADHLFLSNINLFYAFRLKNINIESYLKFNQNQFIDKVKINYRPNGLREFLFDLLDKNIAMKGADIIKITEKKKKYSKSSISVILNLYNEFSKIAPGIYSLTKNLSDSVKEYSLLLNNNQLDHYIRFRFSKSKENLYPLYNFNNEYYLCEWAEKNVKKIDFDSLLYVIEPNKWNVKESLRDYWLNLKNLKSYYSNDSVETSYNENYIPTLKQVFFSLILLKKNKFINFLYINNYITGFFPKSQNAISVLFILLQLNTISYQKSWQSSFSIIENNTDQMINFLINLLNKYGELKWNFKEIDELFIQIKFNYKKNDKFYISNLDIFLNKLKEAKYIAPFKSINKKNIIDDELEFDYIGIIDG